MPILMDMRHILGGGGKNSENNVCILCPIKLLLTYGNPLN